MAIEMAEIKSNRKPRNSAPILKAINIEYSIAVRTPNHSRIKFFVNFGNMPASQNEITLLLCIDIYSFVYNRPDLGYHVLAKTYSSKL